MTPRGRVGMPIVVGTSLVWRDEHDVYETLLPCFEIFEKFGVALLLCEGLKSWAKMDRGC